jgi:hypothetical protein
MVESPMITDSQQPKIKDMFGTPNSGLPHEPHPTQLPQSIVKTPNTKSIGRNLNNEPKKTVTASISANSSLPKTPQPVNNSQEDATLDDNKSPTSSSSAEDFLNTLHSNNIVTNKQGQQVIQNINKLEEQQWYSEILTTGKNGPNATKETSHLLQQQNEPTILYKVATKMLNLS